MTPDLSLPDREHRRIDPDDWEAIYIVGDVHGSIAPLRVLLNRLDPRERDLVVFVGDLVRKGPESGRVVDLVRDTDNYVSVRGNNEAKLLRGRRDAGLTDEQRAALDRFPVAISWDDALVVHGGIDHREPLSAQTVYDLTTARSASGGYEPPFWFDRYEGPPRVFFGHTVFADPFVSRHAVGLDTGCVYGGQLTAYDWHADRFLAVPGVEHETRDPSTILDPGQEVVR